MPKRKSDSLLPDNKRRATDQQNFELYCQPSAALQTLLGSYLDDLKDARFDKVICNAQRGFTDLLSSMLAVLDLRALAYGQSMQVDKGLQDARLMIAYAPFKAAGYLRAGALYSQRSQQTEAMRVYKQGLKTIPKEETSERGLLEERYTQAQALRDRRVDFIKALPFDLVSAIITLLPKNTLYQALDVSSTWRHHVLQHSQLWSQLTLTQQRDMGLAYLPLVGQHVQTLELSSLGHGQCEEVFTAVINGMCRKLDFLHLSSSRINDYNRCLMALSQARNTLARLEIVLPKESPPFPLAAVLSTCNNLQRLYYAHYTAVATAATLGVVSTASTCPSLLDMELSFARIDTGALRKLLPCCPKLRRLSIDFCDITAIGAVRDCCPELAAFGFNRCIPMDEPQKGAVFSSTAIYQPRGIRHLAVSSLQGPEYDDLLPLLSENASALESLCFRFPCSSTPEEERIWRKLTDVTAFSNLRQLETNFSNHFGPMAGQLISRCPSLECLSIYFADYIGTDVSQAISGLSSLQLLHLSCVHGVQEDALLQMFQVLATYSSLHTLQLGEWEFKITGALLQAIANISSLKVIELSELDADRTAFQTFAQTLERRSSVHSIILGFLDCVSDDAIRHISSIQSLRRLALYDLENVTEDGLSYVYRNPRILLLAETLK
ncbi:hypothetical protein BJV82DRAFT_674741 [Fennellomyces sp. T-0311]|nr:hypothetical protein BJV82DRAFT_674741 [Fennellomyces sp. T-0311]